MSGFAGQDDGAPRLSVVVPCYNEEAVIRDSYGKIRQALELSGESYEIIFGNDGSSDATPAILEEIAAADGAVRLTGHNPNRGAGYTYREMYGAARGGIIIQMDADLAMPAEAAVPAFLAALEGADVAVGSRYGSEETEYPLLRRVFSRGYIGLIKALFRLGLSDTQTGFVGFRRTVLDELDLRSDGFEILVEFFAQAREAGFRIVEVNLPWVHDTSSGETNVWKESVRMLTGTLRVRRGLGEYRRNRLSQNKQGGR
ncbi:MAG: glycosyltransferase family 2 protein [Gaiellales bacterium]|nr:MAG: glycosyltransferase family 2 protein [Gaiellales bacterium]